MTEDEFLLFIDLASEGFGSEEIANHLGGNAATYAKYLFILRYHGEKKLYHYIFEGFNQYSEDELRAIVEQGIESNIPCSRLALIYLTSQNLLQRVHDLRTKHEYAPVAPAKLHTPLRSFHPGNIQELKEPLVKAQVSSDSKSMIVAAENLSNDNTGFDLKSGPIAMSYSNVSTSAALKCSQSAVTTIKQQTEEKANAKQDAKEISAAFLDNELNNVDFGQDKSPFDSMFEKLGTITTGKAASSYAPNQHSILDIYDVNSEGFDLLPLEVQVESMRHALKMKSIEEINLKKSLCSARRHSTDTSSKMVEAHDFLYNSSLLVEPELGPHEHLSKSAKAIALGMTKQEYLATAKRVVKPDKYREAKEAIRKAFEDSNGTYGVLRVREAIFRKGFNYSAPTVRKLQRSLQLNAVKEHKKPNRLNSSTGSSEVVENLKERSFQAKKRFDLILTDVTEIKTNIKEYPKLYLSAFYDVATSEVISTSIGIHADLHLVLDSLDKLLSIIPKDHPKCIIHSGQGCEYQHPLYKAKLQAFSNIQQSMPKQGNGLNNAAMYGFFSVLKREAITGRKYDSIEQLITSIHNFISFYNLKRIKLKSKYST